MSCPLSIFETPLTISQEVASPSHRALSLSILNTVMSLTGDGPAPFIVGAVSLHRKYERMIPTHSDVLFYSLQLSDFFLGGRDDTKSQLGALQKVPFLTKRKSIRTFPVSLLPSRLLRDLHSLSFPHDLHLLERSKSSETEERRVRGRRDAVMNVHSMIHRS